MGFESVDRIVGVFCGAEDNKGFVRHVVDGNAPPHGKPYRSNSASGFTKIGEQQVYFSVTALNPADGAPVLSVTVREVKPEHYDAGNVYFAITEGRTVVDMSTRNASIEQIVQCVTDYVGEHSFVAVPAR